MGQQIPGLRKDSNPQMKLIIKLVILLYILLGTSSCQTSYQMSSVQVEMMCPSFLTNLEKIDTIAILYRKQSESDIIPYIYHYEAGFFNDTKEKTDTAIQYKNLYHICVDALVNYLDSAKYFATVYNYCDSLNSVNSNKENLLDHPELYSKLGIDAFIFLEPFEFNDKLLKKGNEYIDVKTSFPEFANSSDMEYIFTKLPWTAYLKGDTVNHKYDQYDDSYYGNSVSPDFFGSQEKHKLLVENTAVYFGKAFGSKLIPSWIKTKRSYYFSKNLEMMKAEEFCKNGEWLSAAEIYRRQTLSKNKNISVKSKYNMALVCEMEGNIEAAFDWLKNSNYSKQKKYDHLNNCDQYSKALENRKKELALIEKQVRN